MAPLVDNNGRQCEQGTAPGQQGKHSAGNFHERLTISMGFQSKCLDLGQVGMLKVLSHDGDRILV